VNYFTLAALVSLIVTLLLHPSRRGKRSSRSDRHIVEIRRRLDKHGREPRTYDCFATCSSP